MEAAMYTEEHMHAAFSHGMNASAANNPLAWYSQLMESGKNSDAGVNVTYNSSLTYAYVWRAVSMISRDVAKKSLNVYAVGRNGDMEIARSSPVQWLLNGRPNDQMTAFTFRELLTSHALLMGNGYAFIGRNGGMAPESLSVMLPDSVEIELDEAGRVWYKYTPKQYRNGTWHDIGEPEYIPARDVLHIKGLGWDGLSGHSRIALARNSWGLGMAQQKHGAQTFSQGARPSVVLETEAKLDKPTADMLLQKWDERHADGQKPALLSNGLRLRPFSMSNEDSQWIESRGFQRVEVAVWFGIPPHKLGDSSRTAYNSLEAEERAYINQTLSDWLAAWESECNAKLLTERTQRDGSRVVKHETADLANSDIETKTTVAKELRTAEIINQNEARRILGYGPVQGGEDFTNPNVRPSKTPASEPEPAVMDARVAQSQRKLFTTTLSSLIGTEQNKVKAAARKESNFLAWMDQFYGPQGWVQSKAVELLDPCLSAFKDISGCQVTVSEIAQNHAQASREALLEVAGYSDPESLVDNVEAAVSTWTVRADQVAQSIVEGA